MSQPTVLSISSQVAYGHVGNSAIIAALHSMNCNVIDIPTIILSSHPGHGPAARIDIPAGKIDEILNVLADQGRLDGVDAIISGYFSSVDQIASVEKAVKQVKSKNPAAIYCCDPIIGDELPGMYVPQPVARAIRDDLIPVSDIILPNLFELQYLLGDRVTDIGDCIIKVRENFKSPVLITSMPIDDPSCMGNLLVHGDEAWLCTSPRLDKVPNGTGDLLTGLFVGNYLTGGCFHTALSFASGQLNSVLIGSVAEKSDELVLSHLMNTPSDFPPAQAL